MQSSTIQRKTGLGREPGAHLQSPDLGVPLPGLGAVGMLGWNHSLAPSFFLSPSTKCLNQRCGGGHCLQGCLGNGCVLGASSNVGEVGGMEEESWECSAEAELEAWAPPAGHVWDSGH